jgi:alpha-glucuronidase
MIAWLLLLSLSCSASAALAEDGYDLWLRYRPLPAEWLDAYHPKATELVPGAHSPRLLLWFQHVPWDYKMHSGRTLWDELVIHYSQGVQTVADMRHTWTGLAGRVDAERYAQASTFLAIQEKEAKWWRDASIAYFQTFSHRELPAGYAAPEHDLTYYEALCFPFAPGIAPRPAAPCK